MIDICTCIISCIILVIYFLTHIFKILILETHVTCIVLITWHSWIYHDILSCDLEFLWSCDYVTRQLLVQDVSCSLYTCHTMHARSYCTWSISWLFLWLLLHSVLDISIHIVLMSYLLLLHLHILFYCSFPSCTLASPLLTDLYIIFQYLDQEAGIESCS